MFDRAQRNEVKRSHARKRWSWIDFKIVGLNFSRQIKGSFQRFLSWVQRGKRVLEKLLTSAAALFVLTLLRPAPAPIRTVDGLNAHYVMLVWLRRPRGPFHL